VVNSTPRPLYPRERPGTHGIGGWVGPRAFICVYIYIYIYIYMCVCVCVYVHYKYGYLCFGPSYMYVPTGLTQQHCILSSTVYLEDVPVKNRPAYFILPRRQAGFKWNTLYLFRMILTISSRCFPTQHSPIGLRNGRTRCSPCGTN
jgi:hypothetical protein